MSIASDGTVTEERVSTPVGNTACVPSGTLLTVPSAPSTGSVGTAPVVAVNTTVWYKDATLMSAIGGALLALEPVVEDALRQQTFNWKSFTLSCILALAAWLRNRTNSVVR